MKRIKLIITLLLLLLIIVSIILINIKDNKIDKEYFENVIYTLANYRSIDDDYFELECAELYLFKKDRNIKELSDDKKLNLALNYYRFNILKETDIIPIKEINEIYLKLFNEEIKEHKTIIDGCDMYKYDNNEYIHESGCGCSATSGNWNKYYIEKYEKDNNYINVYVRVASFSFDRQGQDIIDTITKPYTIKVYSDYTKTNIINEYQVDEIGNWEFDKQDINYLENNYSSFDQYVLKFKKNNNNNSYSFESVSKMEMK